jgi:hypothetical protein
MNLESKSKAKIGVGVGLGLEIVSHLLTYGGDQMFLFAVAVFLAATLLFIWGCTHYAISKGLSDWLCPVLKHRAIFNGANRRCGC